LAWQFENLIVGVVKVEPPFPVAGPLNHAIAARIGKGPVAFPSAPLAQNRKLI